MDRLERNMVQARNTFLESGLKYFACGLCIPLDGIRLAEVVRWGIEALTRGVVLVERLSLFLRSVHVRTSEKVNWRDL